MFDAISILIVAGTFLVLLWLSLLIARFLLSAILLSMQRGTGREVGSQEPDAGSYRSVGIPAESVRL